MDIYQIMWSVFTLSWIVSIVMLGINMQEKNTPGIKAWNATQILFVILLNLMAILHMFTSR